MGDKKREIRRLLRVTGRKIRRVEMTGRERDKEG